MKKIGIYFISFCLGLTSASYASAALTLDIVPNGTVVANPGDDLSFDIYLNGDSSSHTFALYAFSLTLDTDELSYSGWTYGNPANFNEHQEDTGYPGPFQGNGFTYYGTFNGNNSQFKSYTLAAGEQLYLGTLSAKAINPVQDGQWDVSLYLNPDMGEAFYFLDAGGPIETIQVTGPDVSPVPVPGTGLLLGSTLLGLVGLRRKRRA